MTEERHRAAAREGNMSLEEVVHRTANGELEPGILLQCIADRESALRVQLADAQQETGAAVLKWNATADALVLATQQLADAQAQVASLRAALAEGRRRFHGLMVEHSRNCDDSLSAEDADRDADEWIGRNERWCAALADTARAASEHDERIWNRARDVGERDGYVLCQNTLQKLFVERLRSNFAIGPLQECIDALSRVQPRILTPADTLEIAAREHDEAVRAAERERCAKMIEGAIGLEYPGQSTNARVAAAIRALAPSKP